VPAIQKRILAMGVKKMIGAKKKVKRSWCSFPNLEEKALMVLRQKKRVAPMKTLVRRPKSRQGRKTMGAEGGLANRCRIVEGRRHPYVLFSLLGAPRAVRSPSTGNKKKSALGKREESLLLLGKIPFGKGVK